MISRRTFVSGLASTGLVGSVVGRDSSLNASADCVRYSTDVPVYGNYDIAVFGAGPAGIAAAIAAARAGKKTVLVEKYGSPGGVSTWGATPLFFRFADSRNPGPKPANAEMTEDEKRTIRYLPCEKQGDPSKAK